MKVFSKSRAGWAFALVFLVKLVNEFSPLATTHSSSSAILIELLAGWIMSYVVFTVFHIVFVLLRMAWGLVRKWATWATTK